MIENPTKQIVHPDSLIETFEISKDTIALAYNEAFVGDGWGPLSRPFPLDVQREYKVVRHLFQNTYSFEEFYSGSSDILGYWVRPSASNSLSIYEDTTQFQAVGPPAGTIFTYSDFNFFDSEPFVQIVAIDSIAKTITTQGYYYHFINVYVDLILDPSGATHEDVIVDQMITINQFFKSIV